MDIWGTIRDGGLAFLAPLPFIAAFLLAGIFWPAVPVRPFRRALVNLKLSAVATVLGNFLSPIGVFTPRVIQHFTGSGWIDLGLSNPTNIWQTAIAFVVYLALTDFCYYWYHRLQHAHWFFWATHRTHHSDGEFDASTSIRAHWVENIIAPLSTAPIAILFAPIGHSAWPVYIFLMALASWRHANLNLSLGPFFISPRYHRIHHSNLPEHQAKNFASNFPLFDILFGTYCAPKLAGYPPVGLDKGEIETTWRSANAGPFAVWRDGLTTLRVRRRLAQAQSR